MNKYIDMHCHILPGVDDGATDLKEMRKMLKIAYKEGIRCIIATPHFHPYRGHASRKCLKEQLQLARQEAKKIDKDFRIFLGNEIYFGHDIPDMLRKKQVLTMNNREYVLIEFSVSDSADRIKQGIQLIQARGYKVILAHIERYECFYNDYDIVENLYEMGVLIQVNARSIIKERNPKAKKLIRFLLENELVYCVGTDAHGVRKRSPKINKAAYYVSKKYGESYARRIFFSNALQMLKKQREV